MYALAEGMARVLFRNLNSHLNNGRNAIGHGPNIASLLNFNISNNHMDYSQ